MAQRLNISGGTGPDEKFTPQPADWDRIEAAYGHSFSDDDRRQIIDLVDKYFFWQPSEPNAPFVDDAINYLNTLEKAGKRFWQAMLERKNIPVLIGDLRLRSDAIIFVQSHVGRYLEHFDFRRKTDWDALQNTMGACVAAFGKTRQYLVGEAADRGFVEGRAWNNLVWNLFGFAEEKQLPVRVSKGDDPARASPFVRFVWELQETFPSRFQRHDASLFALAEAILVARREIKRALARREAQKINSPDAPF